MLQITMTQSDSRNEFAENLEVLRSCAYLCDVPVVDPQVRAVVVDPVLRLVVEAVARVDGPRPCAEATRGQLSVRGGVPGVTSSAWPAGCA